MWTICFIFVLYAFCVTAEVVVEPVLHLRSPLSSRRPNADAGQQRMVLPVSDPSWGPLLNNEQILIMMGVPLTHSLQDKIDGILSAHDGQVINYIPDQSLLAISKIDCVSALERIPGVIWAGQFHSDHKIAPEWSAILSMSAKDEGLAEHVRGKMLNGEKNIGPITGETEISNDFFGVFEFDMSGNEPQLVIEVQFPRLPKSIVGPDYKPGLAASRDWVVGLENILGRDVSIITKEHGILEVNCPVCKLELCLELLSSQPTVHWLYPKPRTQLHNWRASGIIQSGQPPEKEDGKHQGSTHPIWSAGIQGEGQVVGCGDSGIDVDSCFFYDPSVNFENDVQVTDTGKRFFDSETHRKIRYYQASADLIDMNGHGSHVVGSILGSPLYSTDPQAMSNRGMAPNAKIAFIDLGGDDTRSIYTPRELSRFYYPNTYSKGARIHSDSWGSDSPVYDGLSAEVDKFSWDHKDFLPVFAAGNYGELSQQYLTTVTSPAVAKNCIAVGATLTSDQSPRSSRRNSIYTYEMELEIMAEGTATETRKFKILEAFFGGSWSSLINSHPEGIEVVGANPREGCSQLMDAFNVIVLAERGKCTFTTKLRNAEERGALGVIVTNNIQQGYFEMAAAQNVSTHDLTIPMGSIPVSIGRELWDFVESKRSMRIRVSGKIATMHAFDNIADFSSAGPTPDRRVKPDIVAPGHIKSAWSDGGFSSSPGQCKMLTVSGTSMATPVVAGAAALVRQYFSDGFYPTGESISEHKFSPSAALIKASLLGGAFPMDGFTEAGLPLEPPPSFRQGFGRVLLDRSIPVQNSEAWKSGWRMQVVDGAEMNTGGSHNYCVRATGGPIKITLVWTDYPASPSVGKALVNDLDLVVRSAGIHGREFYGNGMEDRVNNVEQVSLEDIPEGNIAITVKGFFVLAAHGPQPYALVVHGGFNGILQSPHNPVSIPSGNTETCIITLAVIKRGPEGSTRNNSPKFEFSTQSDIDPVGGYECQLSNMYGATNRKSLYDWKDCSSPLLHEDLRDGVYEFSVRPKGEEVIVSRSFQVDTKPPQTFILGKPIQPKSSQESVVFNFAAADSTSVHFICKFEYDGPHGNWLQNENLADRNIKIGEWFACDSPQVLNGLPYGSWVFSVQGKDDAGNKSDGPTIHKWMTYFEEGKMYARIISRPMDVVSSTSFTFRVQPLVGVSNSPPLLVDEPLECILQTSSSIDQNGEYWQPCKQNVTYTDVPDGLYNFKVRTQDKRGHGKDSVSHLEIKVDRTPPNVTIIQKPNRYHGAHTVRLKFESTEEVVGYKCAIARQGDSPYFLDCDGDEIGTTEYTLDDGRYTFRVSAEDQAGNIGKSEIVEFMVDTQPPLVVMKAPVPSNQSRVEVLFEVLDNRGSGISPANVSCLLRNEENEATAEWMPGCSSPQEFDLEEGRYVFNIRAVDKAGLHNDPTDHIIIVDKTPPTTTITSTPPEAPQPSLVAFKFVGRDNPARISSLVDYHECQVVDFIPPNTNTSTESSNRIKYDQPSKLNATGKSQTQFLLTSNESSDLRIKDGLDVELGKWLKCESPVVLVGMTSGFYQFRARAIDAAGNVGNATDAILFEVDASLPIPGEVSERDGFDQWVWIAMGAMSITGVVLIVGAVVLCTMRRRRPSQAQRSNRRLRQTRYEAPGPMHNDRSRPVPLHNAGSEETSSGASDDPILSLAIKASIRQQELDAQELRICRELEEKSQIEAAMQASMEDYQYQQAARNSYIDA